ncbi:MAG: hypothetical protein BWK80_01770 [Desulfobacteraceae bacterium IS3]|nr:MAG: hypothetical protein BWK80_01770 [Desulfobacteraceae bacterium IS3]
MSGVKKKFLAKASQRNAECFPGVDFFIKKAFLCALCALCEKLFARNFLRETQRADRGTAPAK